MRTETLFSSASDRWATPKAVYAALDAEFHFDFDPCPLDGEGDGLSPLFTEWKGKRVFCNPLTEWKGKRVFCNPPYGPGIGEWLKRGLEAIVAVFLIPARTDTRWFHNIVLPNASQIRFVKGRLKFGDAKNGAPFPSMIVVFDGQRQDRLEEIKKLCQRYNHPGANPGAHALANKILQLADKEQEREFK